MIQMYRSIGGQDSVGRKPFFTIESESQREGPTTRAHTGHLNVVLPAPTRTEQRRNFWSMRAAPRWNALSDEVKMARNVNLFKNLYDEEVQKRRQR